MKIKTTIIRIPPLVSEPELTVWFVENVFLFLISFIMYPPPSFPLGAAKNIFSLMEIDFSCLSYNTRGLKQKHKRIKIFNYAKEKVKNGFVFFQETHTVKEDRNLWKKEWGEMFCSTMEIAIAEALRLHLLRISIINF